MNKKKAVILKIQPESENDKNYKKFNFEELLEHQKEEFINLERNLEDNYQLYLEILNIHKGYRQAVKDILGGDLNV